MQFDLFIFIFALNISIFKCINIDQFRCYNYYQAYQYVCNYNGYIDTRYLGSDHESIKLFLDAFQNCYQYDPSSYNTCYQELRNSLCFLYQLHFFQCIHNYPYYVDQNKVNPQTTTFSRFFKSLTSTEIMMSKKSTDTSTHTSKKTNLTTATLKNIDDKRKNSTDSDLNNINLFKITKTIMIENEKNNTKYERNSTNSTNTLKNETLNNNDVDDNINSEDNTTKFVENDINFSKNKTFNNDVDDNNNSEDNSTDNATDNATDNSTENSTDNSTEEVSTEIIPIFNYY